MKNISRPNSIWMDVEGAFMTLIACFMNSCWYVGVNFIAPNQLLDVFLNCIWISTYQVDVILSCIRITTYQINAILFTMSYILLSSVTWTLKIRHEFSNMPNCFCTQIKSRKQFFMVLHLKTIKESSLTKLNRCIYD